MEITYDGTGEDALRKIAAQEQSAFMARHQNDDLLIDNAATASQNRTLLDDSVTREAIVLNVIAPLRHEKSLLLDEIFEWLAAEVASIDTQYHGSPTYEHDATWMKGRILSTIAHGHTVFARSTN